MYNLLAKSKKEISVLIFTSLICCFLSYAYENHYIVFSGDFSLRFSDADDYMMLVRLRDFFIHGDLSYSLVNRVNAPFGVDIYWSRIYDFFLIIPIWILNLFIGSIQKSLEIICFCISPVIKSILSVVIYKFSTKFMNKKDAFLCAFLFSILPSLGEISEFGRPDHHIFIMMLEVFYLYSFVNIVKNNCENKADYIKSGIVAAACIWTAVETLPLILLSEVILFFSSKKNIDKLEFLHIKTLTTAYLIGIIIFLCIPIKLNNITDVILLSVCLILLIQKINLRHIILYLLLILVFSVSAHQISYDKISTMHLVLYLYGSLYFVINFFYIKYFQKYTIEFSIVVGIIFAVIFLHQYPKFLLGIEGAASDFLRDIWFPKIQDLTSPFESSIPNSLFFCISGIILFISIYDKAYSLTKQKAKNMNIFWWLLIVLNITYFFFTSAVRRLTPTLSMLSLPLIMELGMCGIITHNVSRKTRIAITFMLIIFPNFMQKYGYLMNGILTDRINFTSNMKKIHNSIRQEDTLFQFLDSLSDTPVVIMADPYSGPKILYRTKHNVVAVPFHSQESGVIYSLVITLKAIAKQEETKHVLKITNSSYVLIRKSICLHHQPMSNLSTSMANGEEFLWMDYVELPDQNSDFILGKINKNEL